MPTPQEVFTRGLLEESRQLSVPRLDAVNFDTANARRPQPNTLSKKAFRRQLDERDEEGTRSRSQNTNLEWYGDTTLSYALVPLAWTFELGSNGGLENALGWPTQTLS